MTAKVRWTIENLELFPDPLDDTRYELIDGELHVSRQPDPDHQYTTGAIVLALGNWNKHAGHGTVLPAPGVILSAEDAVAPDVIWYAPERYVVEPDRKLHTAPDLVVEILSPGPKNERRDLEIKLDLYSRYGVKEYWIADWRERTVQVHRRHQAGLRRVATLMGEDTLTSPLLPSFSVRVAELFPPEA